MSQVELSIIIPTFNEEEMLPRALTSLARQKDISLEIIVSDGGSTDFTKRVVLSHNLQSIFLTNNACNKAEQLNRGAAKATGEFILFMHADCSFPDDLALRTGVDLFRKAESSSGKGFAGHFRLKFERNSNAPSLGYTYLERKASLNRPGCAHGDQGIMLSQKLFAESGSFSENSPLLSETRLADQLRETGQWLLIPADIMTSARRFEKEGLKERQILNAVIMSLGAAGMDQMVSKIPDIYREHGKSGRLDIYQMLVLVKEGIGALSRGERRSFWLRIGESVSNNAWQVPFFLDVRREFRADGVVRGDSLYRCLDRFDRFYRILICNKLCVYCASIIARIWFKSLLFRVRGRG